MQRQRKMNQRRWRTKKRTVVHRKKLRARNFTKFFLKSMFKNPKTIQRCTIIPLIPTIVECPWNQSSLNYLARQRRLPNRSILQGQVRERISISCLTQMLSPFRRTRFYRELSREDRKTPNHPSRCPYPYFHIFSPFFLFPVFCVFCREWSDKVHQQSLTSNLMRDSNQV